MSPERSHARPALLHPLFVAALITLVVNDHVLKGAGLLPSVVTGKLSDVAGLLVAPAVLAWLVRARTERGWLLAHVAVGTGFALLQLWPALARAVEHATAAIGLAFRIWPDPTDLLALPALALSYAVLRAERERGGARLRLEPVVGTVALVACTATSPSAPPRYPFRPGGRVETDVYLRHTGADPLEIRVLRLRDDATLDCERLEDPSALTPSDFGHEQAWQLVQGDMVPLWDRLHHARDRECYAVRLLAQGREWILAWRHGNPPVRPVELRIEPTEPAEPEAVVLSGGEDPPRVPEGVVVRDR